MARHQTTGLPRPVATGRIRVESSPTPVQTRRECLEQILLAFRDIADLDDIHQAGERLVLVRQWIEREAERAAADPIFVDLRLV